MTREEKNRMYEKIKEGRAQEKKQEKERKENGGFKKREYEKIEYVALETDVDIVVRFLGEPPNYGLRNLPTSAKLVCHSPFVLADNEQYCKITWPERDYTWLLWKVYNTVTEGEWDGDSKIYFHKESHPELFKRVTKNNTNNSYDLGMRPSKYYVFNVIDRKDMDWHKKNKHTKLLSKKVKIKNGIAFYEIGIPRKLWKTIEDNIICQKGYFEDYDVIIRKFADDPYYNAWHPTVYKAQFGDDADKIMKYVNFDFLTEEEELWEMYDIDKLFPVSSYRKIKRCFSRLIKQVDVEFNTQFYEELEDLCSKEEKEWNSKKNDNDVKTKSTPVETEVKSVAPEESVKEEVKEVRKSRGNSKEVKTEINWNELKELGFEGIDEMTDEEKSFVKGVDENGEFIYNLTEEEVETKLADCSECGFPSIDPEMHVCPKCSKIF